MPNKPYNDDINNYKDGETAAYDDIFNYAGCYARPT